jgi:ADP-ribose pyrophosphatase YjhB (NUDIX family)
MIQESKPECRGKWFLPGGRVEDNENIKNAMIREIKEEANLTVNLEGLFYFDESDIIDFRRYRFVFLCTPHNMNEKDVEDEHSIRSKWVTFDEINQYDLRSLIVSELIAKYKLSRKVMNIDNFITI